MAWHISGLFEKNKNTVNLLFYPTKTFLGMKGQWKYFKKRKTKKKFFASKTCFEKRKTLAASETENKSDQRKKTWKKKNMKTTQKNELIREK